MKSVLRPLAPSTEPFISSKKRVCHYHDDVCAFGFCHAQDGHVAPEKYDYVNRQRKYDITRVEYGMFPHKYQTDK